MRKFFIALGLTLATVSVHAERNQHYQVSNDKEVIANIQVRQQQDNELLITRQGTQEDTSSSMLMASFENKRLAKFSYRSSRDGEQYTESFSQNGHVIRWKSPKDEGAVQVDNEHVYLSADFTPVYLAELVKRHYQQDDRELDIAPGGLFSSEKLQELKLTPSNKTLVLYRVTGRSVRPDYLWLDTKFNLAAAFDQEFSYYDIRYKDALITLKKAQQHSEQNHWQNLAKSLTHDLPNSLLFKDVTIFDAENSRFLAGQSVLIQNGKIISVAPRVRVPAKTKVIDGKGKTLIPGLWDMHTHTYELGGVLHIAGGVTNARDKGNSAEILERKQNIDAGKLIGPRLYLSGFIDKQSEFNTHVTPPVESLEQALNVVEHYKNKGYSDIKLYGSIPIDWVEPIAQKAHGFGLTVTGHIPQGMKASDAIRAGFDEVTHSNFLLLQFLDISNIDTRTRERHTYSAEHGGEIRLDNQATKDFIQLLKTHHTVIDPTLVGYTAMFTQQEGQFDPRLAGVKQHLPPRVYQSFLTPQMQVTSKNRMAYKASAINLGLLIKLLVDNHIPVVPGTDDLPGLVLHSELNAYRQMGIPITKVLKMATLDAATVAKQHKVLGSIEAGKLADVVLIDGDLSSDISLLSKAVVVIKDDHYFVPAELYQALGMRGFTQAKLE